MKTTYLFVMVFCAVLALAISACDDRTVAEPAVPLLQASVTTDNPDLLKCKPQHEAHVQKAIGPKGGSFNIGPYKFTVPPGALTETVVISATIGRDLSANIVDFGPDGLVFQTPATLTMTYDNCELKQPAGATPLDRDNPVTIAQVDVAYQIVTDVQSNVDKRAKKVSGQVPHFSTYAVAKNYAVAY